jgi:nucleoside-diphosphate-sugar epimerase
MTKNPHLFIFGPGYSAKAVAGRAIREGYRVSGTCRDTAKADALTAAGITPVPFEPQAVTDALAGASHLLASIAPGEDSDPALALLEDAADTEGALTDLRWIGYLSSTNVYGDHDGAWVDETTPPAPGLDRGIRRLAAERAWTALGDQLSAAVHIFRLAGIYGPGRNAVRTVLDGRAKRVVKPGQLFSRIHVDDIAAAVIAAMESGLPSRVFNLADDEPAPPQDVITYACDLLGVVPPPEVPIEDASLSPMARSFYSESKRVRNDRVKADLGLTLRHPDYREALAALVEYERAKKA